MVNEHYWKSDIVNTYH